MFGPLMKLALAETWKKPWVRTVATILATVLLCGAAMGILFKKQVKEPLLGGDNAEWRDEAAERTTFASIVDWSRYSGRWGPSAYYDPVQMVIWRVLITNYNYDRNPAAYHYVCHGIHLVNAVLLALIALSLLGSPLAAAGAGLSFTVFFPNFETAGWVAGTITTGTACLFFLAAVLALMHYLRSKWWPYLVMSALAYILGLLTKEWVVFAFPVMVFYYLIFHRERVWKPRKSDLIFVPHAVLTIPIALIVFSRIGKSAIVNAWGGFDFSHHMGYRFFDYFSFLVAGHPVAPTTNAVITAVGLVVFPALFWLLRKDKEGLFLLLWLVLGIGIYVYSNFRDVATLQRYLYIPSVPWFLLLFRLAQRAAGKYFLWALIPLLGYTAVYNIHLIRKAIGA
jgi:hypothetical protein